MCERSRSTVSRCHSRARRWPRALSRAGALRGDLLARFPLLVLLGVACGADGVRERDALDDRGGSLAASSSAGSGPSSAPGDTPASGDGPPPSPADPGPERHRGDDAPERIIEIGEIITSPPPPECVAKLPARLPDCSPEDPTPRGLDCDGDGVLDHRIYNCDVATAERPAMFAGDFDCQPDDPGLRYWVSRDADGDGAGSGRPLCAGPRVPEGHVRIREDGQGYDCDDSIRAIHPGADEIWGDGFDSDCSNSDFPACGELAKGSTPARVLATGGCSDGPDLYLSSIAACGHRCLDFGSLLGFVGNSGAELAAGPIRLGYRDDSGREGLLEVSPEGLAPNTATPLFEVPFSLIGRIELWVEASDCDPDNGRFVLELPGDPDAICPI
jgi:hypothetical protein